MSCDLATGTRRPLEALFLVDSGPRVGSGHLSRCLAFAKFLVTEGWSVVFACPGAGPLPADPSGGPWLRSLDLADILSDLSLARASSDRGGYELAVVDHYGLAWEAEASLRRCARRIVAIDDNAERRHDCDILVDATAGRRPTEYAGLVPPSAMVFAGTGYALLGSSFAALRERSLQRSRDEARAVFISLGGSTAQRLSAALAQAVAWALPEARIVVAMTLGAAGLSEVHEVVQGAGGRIRLLEGVQDVAEEMAGADLAIGAAGTTAWERCCLGLPALVMAIAENQIANVKALVAAGAACQISPEVSGPDLRDQLRSLDLKRMSASAASLCDGLGVSRVCENIQNSLGGGSLVARMATSGDSRFVWETNNDPAARMVSLSKRPIPWDEHAEWYEHRLRDSDSLILVLESDGRNVGVVRFQRKQDTAVESIALSPRSRGLGLGPDAIRMGSRIARATWAVSRVEAMVRETNAASIRAFLKAGFEQDARDEEGLLRFVEKWPPSGPIVNTPQRASEIDRR